ncbi:MAG: PhoH family protein [Oscillospiraceae bacterium]|nr:PhoH family protein [Oscillospiraceae bacterium]
MAEKELLFDDLDMLMAVFGSCDETIKQVEKEFGVTAVSRENAVRLTGEEPAVESAFRALNAMMELYRGGTPLEEQTVRYCISLAQSGDDEKARQLAGDFICITSRGKPIRPKTLGQKEYLEAISKNSITFGVGPAGTGKTYLAVAMAVKSFKAHQSAKIILTRPAVEAGEKLGFLPGDLQNKVDPYLRPLYDGLFDMLGAENFSKLQEKGLIEVAPLAYMRGRTLDDAFIILDEAQNTSCEQMKMFLTRMGMNSKVIVTGDVTQIDLPAGQKSGLVDALQVLKNIQDIAMVRFSEKDVVRHKLVQEIVKAYDQANRQHGNRDDKGKDGKSYGKQSIHHQ